MNNDNITDIYNTYLNTRSIKSLQIISTTFEYVYINFHKFKYISFKNFNNIEFYNMTLKYFTNINVNIENLCFNNVGWTTIRSENNIVYFTRLNNLITLSISKNKIDNLLKDTFTGLISLVNLRLHHNMIKFIEAGTFSFLIKLKYLYIYHNNIANTGKLTYYFISMKYNLFKTVKSGVFSSHVNKEIDLSFNLINRIERNAFNKNLETLRLNDNLLPTIDKSVFGSIGNTLKILTMFNNQIQCDCNKLKWIFNHDILLLLTISKKKLLKCHQLSLNLHEFNKRYNCKYNKGKYIYIYIYICIYII